MTYRVIEGADHSLSKPEWSDAYTAMLVNWMSEVLGLAKESTAAAKA